MKAYAYKAADKAECEKLIAAWAGAAQILYQHLRRNPLYKPFTKAMLKVITTSTPEEITRVLKPGIYETLLIPIEWVDFVISRLRPLKELIIVGGGV